MTVGKIHPMCKDHLVEILGSLFPVFEFDCVQAITEKDSVNLVAEVKSNIEDLPGYNPRTSIDGYLQIINFVEGYRVSFDKWKK